VGQLVLNDPQKSSRPKHGTKANSAISIVSHLGHTEKVSDLRDPDRDPDHLLAPERLIELETGAEPARKRLAELAAPTLELVQAWLSAELAVARERALEVADFEFAECVCELEQRLRFPGSFMRDAQASLRIQSVLGARAQFRVIQGGG
jgi:hypothetical protein